MFKKGDKVFYKNIGVCEVTGVSRLDFAVDKKQKYYVMKSIFKTGTNYVPVDQDIENIRLIIDKDQAIALIEQIDQIDIKPILDMSTRNMTSLYDDMVNSDSPLDLLKLVLSIDKKKEIVTEEKKKFGAIDDNYLKKAKDMLFEELAAALEIDKLEVRQYIKDTVGYEFED